MRISKYATQKGSQVGVFWQKHPKLSCSSGTMWEDQISSHFCNPERCPLTQGTEDHSPSGLPFAAYSSTPTDTTTHRALNHGGTNKLGNGQLWNQEQLRAASNSSQYLEIIPLPATKCTTNGATWLQSPRSGWWWSPGQAIDRSVRAATQGRAPLPHPEAKKKGTKATLKAS